MESADLTLGGFLGKQKFKLTEEGREPEYDLPGKKPLVAHFGHALVPSERVGASVPRRPLCLAAPNNVVCNASTG